MSTLKTPFVIDFTTKWCGPCHTMDSLSDKMERNCDGKWTLIKIDVESEDLKSITKNITSYPVFAFYKGGAKVF
jgi:thioredoxin-like negative regulator of GroEL